MIRKRVTLAALFALWTLGAAPALVRADDGLPWLARLCLPGMDYWHGRVRIDVENPSERKIDGDSITLTIGDGEGMLRLAGREIKPLRVCDAEGEELLYELLDAQKRPKHEGTLANGDTIAFAVECDPEGRASYYLYLDNPDAGAVSEFWRANILIENGGFEAGDAEPTAWNAWGGDDKHRVSWVRESPHSGERCAKVEVDPGAEPTWVKYYQDSIPVSPGKEYVLRGWVKGRDVKGKAGFYIHVHGQKPMILNESVDAGEGTYDWKEMELRITAPAEAKKASVGTILRGTGSAWYDDVSLDPVDASPTVKARIGKEESLALNRIAASDRWLGDDDPNGPQWEYRLPVRVLNLSGTPAERQLASVDLASGLKSAFRKVKPNSIRVVDPAGAVTPHLLQDRQVLFLADVPAKTEKVYCVYLSSDERIPAGPTFAYADLVSGPANKVTNPSFEDGASEWRFHEPWASIDAGAHSGEKCAKLSVPTDAKPNWAGQHQTIEVSPNTTYLYSGFVKTKGLDGNATLHLHQHDNDHKRIKGQWAMSTRPDVSTDSEWTQTSAVFTTSGETCFVELHLTMNCHGTLWHDDVALCPMLPALPGGLESRMRREVAAGQPKDLAVWLVNPVVKVFREDAPERFPKAIDVCAGRNEYEPVQLVLRAARDLSGVSAKVEPPTNAKGEKVSDIQVDLVGYVPIDYPSNYYSSRQPVWYRLYPKAPPRSDGWAGDWPDPLKPCKPFDLPANQSQPVWITVHVPEGTAPGEYNGNVVITATGVPPTAIPLRLKVWDFTLPKETSLRVIYDLRFRGLRHLYADPESLRPWYRAMAERRVCTDRFRPEMKIDYKGGKVTLDTEGFDKVAAYCLDELRMNSFYTHHLFYTFGWAYPPRKLFGFEAFTPEYKEALHTCLRAYMDHLRSKGWDKKVLCYVSDEPHFNHQFVIDNLATYCKLVHEVEPALRTYSSTWRYVPGYVGAVTAWGVGEYGCFPVEKMEERRKAGDMLIFTTDGQMCIDTPYCGIERMLPYFCWKYHVVGYEFWGISWWTYDPWDKGYHQYISQSSSPDEPPHFVRYPNGDGYLMYPGNRVGIDGPASSVRLEQAREGIEDYEYFILLRDRIAAARAKGIATGEAEAALARVNEAVTIPNKGGLVSTDIMPDPDVAPRIRLAIGEQIEKLGAALKAE